MKNIKKVVSILLSVTLLLSTIVIAQSVSAATNLFVNGDFSDGLNGYEISANKSHTEEISVKNGVCYIPLLTSTVTADKPYNRWINQKVTLKNGTYIFAFDLDITYTSTNAWAFAYAVREENGMDRPIIRPTNGAAPSNVTVGAPKVESLDNVLNTADTTTASSLNSFALSNSSKYYNYSGTAGRQVGKVSFEVVVNNPNAETTNLYFSMGCYANVCSAYIDNISVVEKQNEPENPDEVKGITNGDFSDGLNGYEISANKSHDEEISVKNGACYIPLLTSTVTADKPYNRWINQKVTLKNGTYIFSFDLDITYTSSSAWAFAYAVRDESGIDRPIIRPTNGAAPSNVTVGAPKVESLNNVLNTADKTTASSLNSFALSNSSKYYNYSGTAGRQVGKVSFEVVVNNPNAETTNLYFSMGCYANVCSAYIDNISVVEKQEGTEEPEEIKGITNGDFSDGLNGYEISANMSHDEEISVKNGACYIPKLTSTVTADRPYNRWINQKIVLENGVYTLSFDLDVTYSVTNAYAFAYAVRDESGIDRPILRPTNGATPNNVKVGESTLEALNYVLNTTDSTKAVSLAEGGFAFSNNSKYYNFSGQQDKRYVGKVSFTIEVNNPSAKTTALYFSMGCYADSCSAYIDNITLTEGGFVNSPFSFDFETGGTEGILYRDSDPAYSHRHNLKRTDEDAKQGKYSLSSTAISDEATSGNKVRGSFSLPITNVEKNKNYELSFWFKFKGNDETLKSGFRISKDIGSPETNSLVSSTSQVNYSSDMKFSDATYKEFIYGWAGFIALPNTNKGSDWVKVNIKFNTGDNSTVYLQFVNFAKKGTTFYIDDIKYGIYDGELPVQPIAKYDYENTVYDISFEEDVSIPVNKYGDTSKHYVKSSNYAHSGKYSVEWDGYHDDGWEVLNFTDKVGNVAQNPVLEPNSVYRFSCWMYAVGTGAQNTRAAWNSPVEAKQQSQVIANVSNDWQQFIYTFSTGPEMTSCPVEFAVGINGLQYEGLKVYVDDIKLEKLVCSVLTTDTSDNYCEDIVNEINNGNFEELIKGSIWDTKDIDIELVKETKDSLAPLGVYYAHINGNASLSAKIKLKSGYEYKFMYSYKTDKKSDFKIGILDDNGKEIQPAYKSGVEHTSLLTPKTDGEWHREGYTLFTPASGYVYFAISGKDVDIYLDAISLYRSKLSREEDPNTYDNDITLEDLEENYTDDEIVDDNFEEIVFDDETIGEDSKDSNESDNEVSSSGGKYKKIRRIYTTSWWVYALIIVGGVVVACCITVLVIVLVKKKRRKIVK